MTIFDSFNKPSWQHRDPEVRKSAVGEVEDETVLINLVRDVPDEGVQSAALARIANKAVLEELVQSLASPLLEQARKQWLDLLLPDPGGLSSVSNDQDLVLIAGLTDDPDLVTACIDRIGQPATRLDLAMNHPLAKVRIAAAEGVEEEQPLKELLAASRHKDKSVYRLCKERMDRLHEAERTAAERTRQLNKLADDASSLGAAVDSPEYKARFQVLEHHWAQLKDHASQEQRKQIGDDLEICARRIEKTEHSAKAEESQQALVEQSRQAFLDILAELSAIELAELDLTTSENAQSFSKSLDGIEDRWLAAMHHSHPSSDQTRECKHLLASWRKVAQISRRIVNRQAAIEQLVEASRQLGKSDFMAHHNLL